MRFRALIPGSLLAQRLTYVLRPSHAFPKSRRCIVRILHRLSTGESPGRVGAEHNPGDSIAWIFVVACTTMTTARISASDTNKEANPGCDCEKKQGSAYPTRKDQVEN